MPDLDPARVATDAQLRAALETARAWGAAPTVFFGRAPGPWTDLDRDLALALAAWEAGLCSGCGHPLAQSTDPGNETRYEAGLAIRCHACTAVSRAAQRYEQSDHTSALRIPVLLRQEEPDVHGADPDDRPEPPVPADPAGS